MSHDIHKTGPPRRRVMTSGGAQQNPHAPAHRGASGRRTPLRCAPPPRSRPAQPATSPRRRARQSPIPWLFGRCHAVRFVFAACRSNCRQRGRTPGHSGQRDRAGNIRRAAALDLPRRDDASTAPATPASLPDPTRRRRRAGARGNSSGRGARKVSSAGPRVLRDRPPADRGPRPRRLRSMSAARPPAREARTLTVATRDQRCHRHRG